MGFQSPENMKECLEHGLDYYCPETGEYVFLYSDAGAVCRYSGIAKERALELAAEAEKTGECWSAILGAGGEVYDDPAEFLNEAWNRDWQLCEEWADRQNGKREEEAERC